MHEIFILLPWSVFTYLNYKDCLVHNEIKESINKVKEKNISKVRQEKMKISMMNLYSTDKKESTKLECQGNLWPNKIVEKYERKYKVIESQQC